MWIDHDIIITQDFCSRTVILIVSDSVHFPDPVIITRVIIVKR